MGFFLTEKPWAEAQNRADDLHSGGSFALPAAKLGLRLFLGMVTVLFLLLIFSYGDRMAFEEWRPGPPLWLLWLNTILLLASSAGLQWAQMAARRGQTEGVKLGLLVGGAFTFAFLAGQGFYDATIVHRVVPGFVVQMGDPTGTGTGGPGYRFADELAAARDRGYARGTVAMANAGPDTNGSQFFVCLDDVGLPPQYAVFGRVTSGMDVVDSIAALPLHGETPAQTCFVERVRVRT